MLVFSPFFLFVLLYSSFILFITSRSKSLHRCCYGAGATVAVPPRGLFLCWVVVVVVVLVAGDGIFDVRLL